MWFKNYITLLYNRSLKNVYDVIFVLLFVLFEKFYSCLTYYLNLYAFGIKIPFCIFMLDLLIKYCSHCFNFFKVLIVSCLLSIISTIYARKTFHLQLFTLIAWDFLLNCNKHNISTKSVTREKRYTRN